MQRDYVEPLCILIFHAHFPQVIQQSHSTYHIFEAESSPVLDAIRGRKNNFSFRVKRTLFKKKSLSTFLPTSWPLRCTYHQSVDCIAGPDQHSSNFTDMSMFSFTSFFYPRINTTRNKKAFRPSLNDTNPSNRKDLDENAFSASLNTTFSAGCSQQGKKTKE